MGLMVSVFAVAMAVLGFEVALTRAFSVLLRFHFVFLAISLATCGLGVGGLVDSSCAGLSCVPCPRRCCLLSRELSAACSSR